MLPSAVRTALELQIAIERAANYLEPIGECQTKISLFERKCAGEEDEDEMNTEGGSEVRKHNDALIKQLSSLYRDYHAAWSTGTLEEPFTLTIARPGCEFSGPIAFTHDSSDNAPPQDRVDEGQQTVTPRAIRDEGHEQPTEHLVRWFDNAVISGFGDVRAQETRVDPTVRDAREIPAVEFTVTRELLEEIRNIWRKHFLPAAVRVEPYKIHLYGPGGLFKMHKDTPEKDLVGTFLVGLGDTTVKGGLVVGSKYNEILKAEPGSWVAFYPDTNHMVESIEGGHRAVIAFKIFRTDDAGDRQDAKGDGLETTLRRKIEDILAKLPPSHGMLLEHKYSIGTTELNGWDNIVHAAAASLAQKTGAAVHFLPVLTNFHGVYYHDDPTYRKMDAPVFPLTEAHVDALLAHIQAESPSRSLYADDQQYLDSRASTEHYGGAKIEIPNAEKWLADMGKVPFYCVDFAKATVMWKHVEEKAAEYTGNESRPASEDSIYLSYAMVMLQQASRGRKRKAESEATAQNNAD